MAELIRNENELLSLRVSLEVGQPSTMHFDLWRGSQAIGQGHHVAPSAVGLPEVPSFASYRTATFTLPPEICAWINGAWQTHRHDDHEPAARGDGDSIGKASVSFDKGKQPLVQLWQV